MALKHATKPVETTPEQAVNVAPEETTNGTTSNGENGAGNGKAKGERSPWTDDKVRAVKAAVRGNPGIAFEDLLAKLRDGFLATHLEGNAGRQRLINVLNGIRNQEEKATAQNAQLIAEGKESEVRVFTPLPEVIMPQSMRRPDLLAD